MTINEPYFVAYAVTAEDQMAREVDTDGILIQEFVKDDGAEVYVGELYLETPALADEQAMRDALQEAGWWADGPVDTSSGQSIARVERAGAEQ